MLRLPPAALAVPEALSPAAQLDKSLQILNFRGCCIANMVFQQLGPGAETASMCLGCLSLLPAQGCA